MDKKPITSLNKGAVQSKSATQNKPAAAPKKKISMKEYFKGIKTETKKVVWPTRKELVSYTGVVILTCFVFSIGFWAVDSVFLTALKYLINFTY